MRKNISPIQPDTEAELAPSGTLARPAQPGQPVLHALRKVPEITVFFWVIKLLTTAMGEVTSDYLAHQLDPMIAVAIGGVGLVVALVLQFAVRRYIPWVYWLAVVMVAVFGTMAADVLHVGFHVPYIVSTILFLVVLAIIFATWYSVEKTLSIHSIYTRRRELFYWATVMATFALGTAAGDLAATITNLGYLAAGILFAVLILIPMLGYWRLGLNEIVAFWLAYILTRPLGASIADWLGKARDQGGLGVGTGLVSLILTVLIICFVGYLTVTHKDVKAKQQ
ncbi:membrane protein [Dictyobacter vulcani]|uniref:Membrane protein n=1 Tax=Dictyobacter vulcani TaxID=2607529 RepID=A0A5J4L368_9CHLR|nr:hypothetical protein [Dictyobacter vulcani]GER91906.1 membrane protein [Dictyobacter vulcani]